MTMGADRCEGGAIGVDEFGVGADGCLLVPIGFDMGANGC